MLSWDWQPTPPGLSLAEENVAFPLPGTPPLGSRYARRRERGRSDSQPLS